GHLQIGSMAALFGSTYGHMLLVKTCVFLPIALGSAAWLRLRYLPALTHRSPRAALAVEALAGIGMLSIATLMSQSVPGRSADIGQSETAIQMHIAISR